MCIVLRWKIGFRTFHRWMKWWLLDLDEKWGEKVIAFIALKENGQLTLDELSGIAWDKLGN